MNGEAIVSVSAAVVALTQLAKWGGLPDRTGPLAVLIFSALGVGVWGYSEGEFSRPELFTYLTGWIAVATSAAGVFGFTRATVDAVTSAAPPPYSGAGSERTQKPAEADAAEARNTYLGRTSSRVRNTFRRPDPLPAPMPAVRRPVEHDDTPAGVG